MKLVSVVVPVYNVETYLEKCIDSIIHQDYENVEIILVDDGSTDRSGEICDRYSQQYNNVTTIHQNNMGLSGARNTGTANANGDYIAYVDSDDWVSLDYISYQIKLAEKYNADIVAVKQLSVWNEVEPNQSDKRELVEAFSNKEAVNEMCYGYKFGASACKLIKLNIATKYPFPVGKLYEDLAVMYKMLSECNCVVYSNIGRYFYRRRATSIINQSFNPKHLCILDHTRELRDFVQARYPDITKAAIYKSAYVITQIVPMVVNANEKKVFKSLKTEMRNYFFYVIFNPKVKMKYKIRCMVIVLGFGFAKLESNVENSIKNRQGKKM